MQQYDVLVVDDDESIVQLLMRLLESKGFSVISASNGREAIDLLDIMIPPRLVLLDLMMPFVGGLLVLDSIREHDQWKDVTVMMLTCVSTEADIRQALLHGANDYIIKPFDIENLSHHIDELLS